MAGLIYRRSSVVLLVLIVLAGATILVLPALTRWQLEQQLTELLGLKVRIDTLELNLFRGSATVKGLTIGEAASLDHLGLDVRLLPLLGNELQVENIDLAGLRLPIEVDGGALTVAGYEVPAGDGAPSDGAAWRLLLAQAVFSDIASTIRFDGNVHDVQINKLVVRSFDSNLGSAFEVTVDARIDGASVNAEFKVNPAAGDLGLAGTFSLAGLSLADYQHAIPTEVAGVLSVRGPLSGTWSEGGAVSIESDLVIRLESLRLPAEDLAIEQAALDGNVTATIDGADVTVTIVGAASVDTFSVPAIRVGRAEYTGSVTLGAALSNMEAAGSARATGIVIPEQGSLATIEIDSVALRDQHVDVSAIRAREFAYPAFGRIESVAVQDVAVDRAGLVVGSGQIDGVDVVVTRLADGQIRGVPSRVEATEPNPGSVEPAPPFTVALGSLSVNGTSRVRFRDESVKPVVSLAFDRIRMTARDIGEGQDTVYEFTARYPGESDEVGVSSAGTIELFGENLSGDLTIDLTGFDLFKVGPYVGGGIKAGRLKLSSSVKLAAGTVTADNAVEISGIRLDGGPANRGGEMPLSVALGLLKDQEDRIKLEVPLSMSVDKLTIGTGDIMRAAVVGAARRAAFSYAKYALQPFGSLFLLKDVADHLGRPRFAPVAFAPQSAVLDETGQAYALKLAALLSDRPALSITVCGYATGQDIPAAVAVVHDSAAPALPAEALPVLPVGALPVELAEQRAQAVRRSIAAAGVDSERLFGCEPTVLTDDSAPRTEIVL